MSSVIISETIISLSPLLNCVSRNTVFARNPDTCAGMTKQSQPFRLLMRLFRFARNDVTLLEFNRQLGKTESMLAILKKTRYWIPVFQCVRECEFSFICHSGLDPESRKNNALLDSGFRQNDKKWSSRTDCFTGMTVLRRTK